MNISAVNGYSFHSHLYSSQPNSKQIGFRGQKDSDSTNQDKTRNKILLPELGIEMTIVADSKLRAKGQNRKINIFIKEVETTEAETAKAPKAKVTNKIPVKDEHPPKAICMAADLNPDNFLKHATRVEYDSYGHAKALYDKNGNLIRRIQFLNDSWPIRYKDYMYDSNGNMIRCVNRQIRSGRLTCKDYAYDAKGNRIREITYDLDGSLRRYYDFIYDSKDKLTRLITRNSDGTVCQYEDYVYNESGNKIKTIYHNPDGSISNIVY